MTHCEVELIAAQAALVIERQRAEASAVALAEQAQERAKLRAALVGLVGVDGREELEQMEAVMRLMAGPAEDKAVTIDAIHALLATVR